MGVGLWLFCATQKRYSVGRPRSHTSWAGRDSFGHHRLGDRGGPSSRSPRLRPSKRSAIRRRLGRHVGRAFRCAHSASTAVRVTWNSRLCGVLPRGVAFARRTRALLSVREGSRANAGASNAGIGFLGMLVGFVLLGAATLRLGVLPRWCGLLLIASPLLAIIFGDHGGALALGLTWLALGGTLLLQRDFSALFPNL